VYVRDLAELTARLVEGAAAPRQSASYIVADSAPIRDVVDALGKILGRIPASRTVADGLFEVGAKIGDVLHQIGLRRAPGSDTLAALRENHVYISSRLRAEMAEWPVFGWRRGIESCVG
jgi:hypothetical protein